MRVILGLWMMSVMAFAYSHSELLREYEAKKYEQVCTKGFNFLISNEKNENIITAIGDACAKVDAINPLGHVVKNLVTTAENRESGSYFATLILQKKLIYQFMLDGINLKELRLPRTEHVLSRVFEELAKGNYKLQDQKVEITTPSMNYLLWLSDDDPKKVYIDEVKEGKLINRHWYL